MEHFIEGQHVVQCMYKHTFTYTNPLNRVLKGTNLMNERVREILSWYSSENAGVRTNLARLLNHGRLGGTGKLVILPVDQGFEHGPARSFAPNPAGYDPRYHFQLAIEAGCNAYAAPLGSMEAAVDEFAGEIPLILKCNNHDTLLDEKDPISAITSGVDDALRLGCSAVGFTIYPGSAERTHMYEQLRDMTAEAKAAGLAVVVWSYPRGNGISKDGETAIDVVTYAAQIAAQLGADIIKVKLPSARVELPEAQKVYQKYEIPIATLTERVQNVIQSSFNGRRIVIFSGGATVADDEVFNEARAIRDGGGFGSIIGRNSFQRRKEDAVKFLGTIMGIYEGSIK
jgi:fructose-bisphosphate aldolase, class I